MWKEEPKLEIMKILWSKARIRESDRFLIFAYEKTLILIILAYMYFHANFKEVWITGKKITDHYFKEIPYFKASQYTKKG